MSDSEGSDFGGWDELLGISGANDFNGKIELDDSEDEEANESTVNIKKKKKKSKPLFRLLQVEYLVSTQNSSELKGMLEQCLKQVEEDGSKHDSIIQLQLGVLQMAYDVSDGNFFNALENDVASGIIAAEGSLLGEKEEHSVSRVKNRMARFLHYRVIEHINNGLGKCPVDTSFRDPEMASTDVHVNQRALRTYSCVLLGAACLGLYMQANWTGPQLEEKYLKNHYPLPYVQNVYDKESKSKTNYLENAMEELNANAKQASAAAGENVTKESIDQYPELHARCALMLGANGEIIYSDALFLNYLFTARVILRIVSNPTIFPGAVDPVDMLETAKIEDEFDFEKNENHDENTVKSRPVDEKVDLVVRRALTHIATSSLFAARSAVAHQESLVSQEVGAASLAQEANRGFKRVIEYFNKKYIITSSNNDDNDIIKTDDVNIKLILSRLWLEQGIGHHKFKEPKKAKVAFHKARELAGLNISLSGAMGRRTKYQKEEKSQLILLASSNSTVLKENIKDEASIKKYSNSNNSNNSDSNSNNDKQEEKKILGEGEQESEAAPGSYEWGADFGKTKIKGIHKVKLEEIDEDTPLHESLQLQPASNDKENLARKGTLSLLDQSIVLALCIDVENSYAMEGLTAEEMLAYVERILQSPENWMVYSTGLLIKSRLEFLRTKTKERGVLQMQVLVDQQSTRLTPLQARQEEVDDSAPVQERFEWLNALAWPALWELKRGLARHYLDLGVAGSALKIFTEVKLWEEAVDCLVIMDRKARAEELARARLEIAPSPNLMCILGSLVKDHTWYQKAWELSGKRYSRAKRLLAIWSFSQNDFAGAIDHLQDALEINPQYPGSWFRLGSAAMRLPDYKLARKAFAQVTKQDPEDGDAWANLSSVLVHLGDFRSALQCAEKAAGIRSGSWKVWENYISLSVQTQQWAMVINGVSKLIDLRHERTYTEDQVDSPSLLLVVDAIITADKKLNEKQMLERESEVGFSEDGKKRKEEKNMSSEMILLLKDNLETLFEKIKATCKSNANVWRLMSVYFESQNKRDLFRDALLRRVRAMQQQDQWERDEIQTNKIIRAVITLHEEYMKDSEKNEVLKKDLKIVADKLVQSTIDRINVGTLGSEFAEPLKELLA